MRGGAAQGEDGAPRVTRRVVRLFVLLGVVVAAYLVLSFFDHAARADAGSIGQNGLTEPATSVKVVATGAKRAVPAPKSIIPKSTAPKARPQKVHRPAIKRPDAHSPKGRVATSIHASKIQAPGKVRAPRAPAGETVRRVQAGASKVHRAVSDVVRDAARAKVPPARTAIVRLKLSTPARLPSGPELRNLPQAALAGGTRPPDLPPSELRALPQLPSWPQLHPGPQLPSWPQLHPGPQPPGLPPALTLASSRTTALAGTLVPHQLLAPQLPAPERSAVTKPPAALAQPGTTPHPAPPRQPADRSAPAGQARDSGGGNAPAMGTVSSSWRPEVTAVGRRLPASVIARGLTVRYAGPPS
jgi:hypothetical protein